MIEQFMDIFWWALAAGAPFLVGNMGSQPSPPTLDTSKSKELTKAELEIKRNEIGPTTAAAGDASRREYGKNLEFALRGFTNPASVIYGDQIKASSAKLKTAQEQLGAIRSGLRQGKMFDQVSSALGDNQKLLAPRALTADERKRLQAREKALTAQIKQGQTQIKSLQSRNPVAELTRAFAPEFAARDQLLKDMQGAKASTAEYLRYQDQLAEGGELGKRLMAEALNRSERGFGVLSAQAERDATQQARSAMAARGMATSNAGIGAELLNRDRYQRARAAEDINFVGGVMNDQTARLGTSAQLADGERRRQLGLGQDAYNFRLSTNPKLMLAGLGSPYANMTSNAMQMVSGAQFTPQYSGGQFSSGGGFNMMGAGAGAMGGALSGAAIGTAITPGIGTVIGGVAGGLLGGGAGGLSDKREKTDIKPLGTLSNVLKIPAYEYRYKGEKKKRKGVMAQDVQKVLPEAVAEVDYKGKKRLAIKPDVIGAALAQELTEQSKAVAA